ncbi:MAG: hypothetical protein ACOC7N_03615 [Chloroflexota bacterium]
MKTPSPRPDVRRPDELRSIAFTLDYIEYPEGSVLIEMGGTRVLCNASVEVQGTAEGEPSPRRALDEMLDLAERGVTEIMRQQQEALRSHGAIWGEAGAAR